MRLRTRLSLSFSLLALALIAGIGLPTVNAVTDAFEAMFRAQLTEAEGTLEAELEREGRGVVDTVTGLAGTAPTVMNVAKDLFLGQVDLASLVPMAEGLLAGLDLEVLYLLDDRGRVLSSGHLPARFGYQEAALLSLARDTPGTVRLDWVEVREAGGIARRLALLSGRPVTYGEDTQLFVVGGRAVGSDLVVRIAELTGGAITLETSTGEKLASAPPPRPPPAVLELPGLPRVGQREGRLPVGPEAEPLAWLTVSVSDAPLARVRNRIALTLMASAAVATVLAILLGGILSVRITRPVRALAAAAGEVAGGNYETRVEVKTSGELGRLVDAFNTMTDEVQRSHARIATAERVAAWQEIARRLAHEIKNPLTPISMSIETLRRTWDRKHPDFEEIFDESTTAIQEEVLALRRIVDEFSRFARLPAPSPQATAPGELIDGTLGLFAEPPAGIRITRTVEDGLRSVTVDRDQLQQVLLNLVTNAVQALEGRGGHIVVGAAAESGGVALFVQDDGPGIDEANLENLFTPYFTTKETGTGLGLAICHRIIGEHGGQIDVISQPGEGARFVIHLPVVQPG